MLSSFLCPLHGSTIDVVESVARLVEADWIKADIEFDSGGRFSPEHTNQLIIRGYKLAERLRGLSASESRLEPLATELCRLEARLTNTASTADDRRGINLDVRQAVRKIAFCNPLLDIDKSLFIKRHDSMGVFHMCDQYYGCNAKPGGGLFVLANSFGERRDSVPNSELIH